MKGFFVIFFCTITVNFFCSQPEIELSPLTIDQGLSQNSVNCILQDQRGFIWIGTTEGLNRFDGIDFKVYKSGPQWNRSLSGNWIRCIHEEREGILWIGTNLGLNRFDIRSNTVSRYLHSGSNRNSLSSNEIYCLYKDHRKNLWVGTKDGLNRINLRDLRIDRCPLLSVTETGRNFQQQITGIIENPLGNLWIILNHRLYELNPETGNLLHSHESRLLPARFSQKDVICFHKSRRNGYWIVTNDSKLHYMNVKNGESGEFPLPFQTQTRTVKTISCIYEDIEGDLWIGSYKGFFIFRRRPGKYFFYPPNPSSDNPAKNCVTSIFEDQSGLVWIGTYGGGVIKVKKNTRKFSTFEADPSISPHIRYASVFSIFKDSSGILWIGTSQGLKCWNSRKEEYIHFRHDPNRAGTLHENQVNALCEDKSGHLWLGTPNGLSRMNTQRSRFRVYLNQRNEPSSLSNNHITALKCDRQGRIWVGTKSGLNLYDPLNDHFIRFFHDPGNSGSLSHNEITAIIEDCNGSIWAGTSEGGLNRMDMEKAGIFQHLKFIPFSGTSGNPPEILALHEDPEGKIWIGTRQGLYGFDRETGERRQYTESDGLPSNTIYGIIGDENGDLWVSTNNGIARLNDQTSIIRTFSESDGLLNNEFNRGALFKDSNGTIFFGGITGFNYFHPKKLQGVTVESQIILRNIELHGSLYQGWNPYSESNGPVLKLNYKKNTITFDYILLDYRDPWKTQYKYMLDGVDTDWNPPTKAHRATYSSLKPGKYTFHVQGCNADGAWTDAEISTRFVISPPFWKTVWFNGTFLSFVFLILLSAHFHRVRKTVIKEKNKYEKISLTRQQAKELLKRIESFMKNEKPYRNPRFNLSSLSKNTAIPGHCISSIINNELKMNFSSFANRYRVKESIRIVMESKGSGKLFQQAFREAGFSSRSAFNQSFFKETGQSPGEYFDDHRIRKFLIELDRLLKSNQTIPQLAKTAGFSSSTAFHRAFKKKTGRSPQDYINEFRIEKAVKILKDTSLKDHSLQWVASEAGFSSQSAFTLAFKKVKKESPSHFRRNQLL